MCETLLMLNMFMSQIEYSRKDVINIITDLADDTGVDNLTFISDCCKYCSDEYSFSDAWKRAVSEFPYYKSEEKNKMLQYSFYAFYPLHMICLYLIYYFVF